jgi:cytochrome c oxidase subunit 4
MSFHHYDPAATLRSYFMVFGALMVGSALTVVASEVDMGPLNNAVALSIAMTKAGLVIAIFMHARGSSNLVKFCIFGSLFFLSLMFYFPLIDLYSRGMLGIPGK